MVMDVQVSVRFNRDISVGSVKDKFQFVDLPAKSKSQIC